MKLSQPQKTPQIFTTGNEEIKFHDPSDFVPPQEGAAHLQTHHQGGAHPEARVSHTHSLRGGPSDHEKE